MTQPSLPGVMTANDLTARLLIEIPREFPGARVWRRNVGKGIGLDTVKRAVGLLRAGQIVAAVEILQHRPVAFGVPGEPDIDGIMPIGRYGVRVGIEVKVGADRLRDDQMAFRDMLLRAGGIFVLARSVEQAIKDLRAQVERQ